jgi:hypothetical protein
MLKDYSKGFLKEYKRKKLKKNKKKEDWSRGKGWELHLINRKQQNNGYQTK